ncbi:MAG: hypothetical protein QOF30_1674 [Acidimicrobiaceae bacterium]|nr:hypothetical protein [Acidimicrobiaceae bacterium]
METAKNVKGEVKEVLGAVTGDRRVEAEGRVEQQVADPDAPQSNESDAAVGHAERDVREDHHDVPGAPADEDGPLGTT